MPEKAMGYRSKFPVYQLGHSKILWGMRGYGFSGVWLKRVTTVTPVDANIALTATLAAYRRQEVHAEGISAPTAWTIYKKSKGIAC